MTTKTKKNNTANKEITFPVLVVDFDDETIDICSNFEEVKEVIDQYNPENLSEKIEFNKIRFLSTVDNEIQYLKIKAKIFFELETKEGSND